MCLKKLIIKMVITLFIQYCYSNAQVWLSGHFLVGKLIYNLTCATQSSFVKFVAERLFSKPCIRFLQLMIGEPDNPAVNCNHNSLKNSNKIEKYFW
jgi:hypothetical protein